jgi:hypothetical protein
MVRFGRGFPIPHWRYRRPLDIAAVFPVIGIVIDGASTDIQPGWRVSERMNETGTFRFSIISLDGSVRPSAREPVQFWHEGVLLFAGHIFRTTEAGLGGYGVQAIETSCEAVDYNALTDRRIISVTLAAGTLKSQLQTLEPYLTSCGVALDVFQADGPSMEELVVEYESLTSVFNKLCLASGYARRIDYNKVLSMFSPGSLPVVSLSDTPIGDVTVSPSDEDYANYIIVRWTEPAVKAYAFFEMSVNAADGETTTIGGEVYTFKNTPAGGNDVQIGAAIADTIDNLIVAAGAHSEVDVTEQASDMMRVTAKTAGATGNTIQVTTTCANSEWITEGSIEVSTLRLGVDAALTGASIAQDVGEQNGGADLIERVYSHPEVVSEAVADDLSAAYLAKGIAVRREIRYNILLPGLHPGMNQTLTCSNRNVSGTVLVVGMEITANGNVLWYDVTATDGAVVSSAAERWRELTAAG